MNKYYEELCVEIAQVNDENEYENECVQDEYLEHLWD